MEQGVGSKEQGAESREQGVGCREQGIEDFAIAKLGIYSRCSFMTQHAVSLHALSKESVEGQCERQNRKIHILVVCSLCLFSCLQYA